MSAVKILVECSGSEEMTDPTPDRDAATQTLVRDLAECTTCHLAHLTATGEIDKVAQWLQSLSSSPGSEGHKQTKRGRDEDECTIYEECLNPEVKRLKELQDEHLPECDASDLVDLHLKDVNDVDWIAAWLRVILSSPDPGICNKNLPGPRTCQNPVVQRVKDQGNKPIAACKPQFSYQALGAAAKVTRRRVRATSRLPSIAFGVANQVKRVRLTP